MQDTSTGQYGLIELLTQGWDGRSQTVFLVGDPKQSIYLFRQARVERFVRTMQTGQLGELPVGCLRLTANFRSQQGLVEEFNEDFSLLFPRDVDAANPEEVPYAAAVAVNGPRALGGVRGIVWHTGVLAAGGAASREDGALPNRRRDGARDRARSGGRGRCLRAEVSRGRSPCWCEAANHLIDVVSELKREG